MLSLFLKMGEHHAEKRAPVRSGTEIQAECQCAAVSSPCRSYRTEQFGRTRLPQPRSVKSPTTVRSVTHSMTDERRE